MWGDKTIIMSLSVTSLINGYVQISQNNEMNKKKNYNIYMYTVRSNSKEK